MSGRGKGQLRQSLREKREAVKPIDVPTWPDRYGPGYVQQYPGTLQLSFDSPLSLTTAGLIGGAIGLMVPLVVIVGLLILLMRRPRAECVTDVECDPKGKTNIFPTVQA